MSSYRVADIEIDLDAYCVRRSDGAAALRQQTTQVLHYLIAHRDRVVPKDELIAAVWKDVAVTDGALTQCIKEIRQALDDDVRNPRFIRTVPRAGYQFLPDPDEPQPETVTTSEIEEVRSIEVEIAEDDERPIAQPLPRPARPARVRWVRALWVAAVVVPALAGAVAAWRFAETGSSHALALPDRPGQANVVVTFLENQTGRDDLDWMREGLADMLITDLARSPNLRVLGRQQVALLLQHRGLTPREALSFDAALDLARAAHAATLVTGSFKAAGDGVRVDVSLYDVASGQLVTADRINVARMDELFGHVDTLASRMAERLGAAVDGTRQARGLGDVMTTSLEAYRDYSEGVEKAEAYHLDEALDLLRRAVALDPGFVMAQARIGYAYIVQGDSSAAQGAPYLERAFQAADRLTERDRLSIAAWDALARRDYTGAIEAYRRLLARAPDDTEAYWRLGILLDAEERFDEALDTLRRGNVVDPYYKQIYNALGGVYGDMERLSDSLTALEHYAALAPSEPNAFDSIGLCHQQAGQFDRAMAAYDRALTLDPNFRIALIHRGNLHFQRGEFARAIDDYTRYTVHSGSLRDQARGHVRQAWVWFRKGDLDHASREIQAARAASPGDVDHYWEVMAIESERGRRLTPPPNPFPTTGRAARGFLRIDYYRDGLIALEAGRLEDALASFREVLRHRPTVWAGETFDDCVARFLARTGRWREAVEEYRRVLSASPHLGHAHYELAQAYERLGDRARANVEYRAFLERWSAADPDIQDVMIAKQRLSAMPSQKAID